jgi:hypothetical protein
VRADTRRCAAEFSKPNALAREALKAAFDGSATREGRLAGGYLREKRDYLEARVGSIPGP